MGKSRVGKKPLLIPQFPTPHSPLPVSYASLPSINPDRQSRGHHAAAPVLKEVDLIACEDTRRTWRLLNHFGIAKPTISYHEHNEPRRAAELAEEMPRRTTLSIDAGTPGISRSGLSDRRGRSSCAQHARARRDGDHRRAVAASGLPTDSFLFAGFLPGRKQARRARLDQLKVPRRWSFTSGGRIRESLLDVREILGDRQAVSRAELDQITYRTVHPRRGLGDHRAFRG